MDPTTVLVADPLYLFADAAATALALDPGLSILDERPGNGPAVVEAIAALEPDIALIDYWMPDMEGPAITGAVLARAPHCKVILMFWMAGPPQIQLSLEAGAAGFVSKDGSVASLAEVIHRVAGGEIPYFDPRLDPLLSARKTEASEDLKRFQTLTPRQIEVLSLLNQGLSTRQVASRLEIGAQTIRNHISEILAKVQAQSAAEALSMARKSGFLRA